MFCRRFRCVLPERQQSCALRHQCGLRALVLAALLLVLVSRDASLGSQTAQPRWRLACERLPRSVSAAMTTESPKVASLDAIGTAFQCRGGVQKQQTAGQRPELQRDVSYRLHSHRKVSRLWK